MAKDRFSLEKFLSRIPERKLKEKLYLNSPYHQTTDADNAFRTGVDQALEFIYRTK